jgi:hypothetical protein
MAAYMTAEPKADRGKNENTLLLCLFAMVNR